MIAPFSFLDVYAYHFVRMFCFAVHAISLACVYARTTPAHPLFWACFFWFNNLVVVVSVASVTSVASITSVASVALGITWMGRRRHWTKGCVDEGCVGRRYTRCYLRVGAGYDPKPLKGDHRKSPLCQHLKDFTLFFATKIS